MSWAAQAYVKSLRIAPNGKPLTATEKLLLLIMSEYYNPEEDMAWASVPELSKFSLLSERQTRRVLHALVNKKVLVSIPRLRSNGATTSNGYRMPGLQSPPPDIAVSAPDTMSSSPPDIAVSPSPLTYCQGAPDILTGAFLKPGSETQDLKTPLPLTSFVVVPPVSLRSTSPMGEDRYSAGFKAFWAVYPIKKGKGRAWKSWQRQKLDPLQAIICRSVEDHLDHDDDWRRGFIKHPETFLNGQCWEDDLTPSPAAQHGLTDKNYRTLKNAQELIEDLGNDTPGPFPFLANTLRHGPHVQRRDGQAPTKPVLGHLSGPDND